MTITKRNILSLLLFFALAIILPAGAFAAETQYKTIEPKSDVSITKTWHIKFSMPLAQEALNYDQIKVIKKSNGQMVNNPLPEIEPGDDIIRLAPPHNGYEYNTEYILIVDKIKSIHDKPLKQAARMEFTTEKNPEDEGNAEDATDADYFVFNSYTGTITQYYPKGTSGDLPEVLDPVIPSQINNEAVTGIEQWAFSDNHLTSVTIPAGVTTIGEYAFHSNHLTSVTIPAGVTTIGESAFSDNHLTSVTIPASVTTIGAEAFRGNWLTSVTIPAGVTTIEDSTFYDNQLTSVTIPEGVTSIGRFAFADNQLTSVTIPEGVTSIGGSAFSDNQLTIITIGSNIEIDYFYAFPALFYELYNDSGQKAGTYLKQGDLKWISLLEGEFNTYTVLPGSHSVTTDDNITISLGEYVLEEETTMIIRPQPVEENTEEGYKIVPYDIKLGNMTNLDDFITIRIPYDEGYCEPGQDASRCVGAKYLDETTGQWEDILFEVDAQRKEIIIYTDHLSVFGVFYIKNEGRRDAHISDIFYTLPRIDTNEATDVLKEYVARSGKEGEKSVSLGASLINDIFNLSDDISSGTGMVSDITNIASLGAPVFESKLGNYAFDKLGQLGTLASAVKIGSIVFKSDATDEEKLNAYKDTAYLALGFSKFRALGLAMSGVWIFDYVISSMFEQGMQMKMEKMGRVYEYFNDEFVSRAPGIIDHRARTLKEWRQILIDIVEKYPNNEDLVKAALEREIDSYARKFWDIDFGALGYVLDRLNYQRMPYPSDAEIETLVANYKLNLYDRLYPVGTSVSKYFQRKAHAEYLETLSDLRKFYNQIIYFKAVEDLRSGETSTYAGYTLCLEPLSENAADKSWTGTIKADGSMSTKFTLLGFIQAGAPNKAALYASGEDKPDLEVPFILKAPLTEVKLPPLPKVTILGPKIIDYELTLDDPVTEITHTFEAVATPKRDYDFVWDIDDPYNYSRQEHETDDKSSSKISCTYRHMKSYNPKVRIYDKATGLHVEDSVTLTLSVAEGDAGCGLPTSKLYSLPRWYDDIRQYYGTELLYDEQRGIMVEHKYGLYESLHPDGETRRSRGCYADGEKKFGLWEEWHYTGVKISEETYARGGLLDGVAKKWRDNGHKQSEENYEQGKKHGLSSYYWDNGNISREGYFDNDEKVGQWKHYYDDGRISCVYDYDQRTITRYRYDSDGTITDETTEPF